MTDGEGWGPGLELKWVGYSGVFELGAFELGAWRPTMGVGPQQP